MCALRNTGIKRGGINEACISEGESSESEFINWDEFYIYICHHYLFYLIKQSICHFISCVGTHISILNMVGTPKIFAG